MGRRSKYPEEVRRNAAKLALDGGRSVREVARELGVNHETLRNWVEALRCDRRDGPAAVGCAPAVAAPNHRPAGLGPRHGVLCSGAGWRWSPAHLATPLGTR